MGRFAFIAALVAVLACLVGCEESETERVMAERERQRISSPVALVREETMSSSAAVEARAWEFHDGTCWCVVGRPSAFIVYRKVDGAWRPTEAVGPIIDLAGLKPPAEVKP